MLRPHILWFDESYSESHYHSETVRTFSHEMDALVVVGTALETALARRIVVGALQNDILTIDVNPDSVLENGNALIVTEPCESALPKLVDEFKS